MFHPFVPLRMVVVATETWNIFHLLYCGYFYHGEDCITTLWFPLLIMDSSQTLFYLSLLFLIYTFCIPLLLSLPVRIAILHVFPSLFSILATPLLFYPTPQTLFIITSIFLHITVVLFPFSTTTTIFLHSIIISAHFTFPPPPLPLSQEKWLGSFACSHFCTPSKVPLASQS